MEIPAAYLRVAGNMQIETDREHAGNCGHQEYLELVTGPDVSKKQVTVHLYLV